MSSVEIVWTKNGGATRQLSIVRIGADACLRFVSQPVNEKCFMTKQYLLDLRGVACPMNFIRTKLLLDSLPEGSVLEVWLDKGEPVESVCASVEAEGHAILQSQPQKTGYFQVLIKKQMALDCRKG